LKKAYSTFQAAKILGVSPPTVIKWANDGLLKSYRTPGGHRRILDVDLQSFLDGFQIPKTKESVRKKVVIFMSDDDYAQLLGEFFDNPNRVSIAGNSFQLGWNLAQRDVSHLIWDWYENTVESLRMLSQIRKEPSLSQMMIIGFLPLYEQINPSFLQYFDLQTTKSSALQNLGSLIGDLD
jgi:excisionase family DNA binding protein